MVLTSKTAVCDLQGCTIVQDVYILFEGEGGFEMCSHLYNLLSLFLLNRNTISMSMKLERYFCTPLLFFLDWVCQMSGSSSSIAPSFRAYPSFCIQYTVLHGWDKPRQASKLICAGNMRFSILLGHSNPSFHD